MTPLNTTNATRTLLGAALLLTACSGDKTGTGTDTNGTNPTTTVTTPTTQSTGTTTGTTPTAPVAFRLPEDNFVVRKEDPILIFPRPDAETPEWAKHRRHLPGVGYRVPIGVAFGSWPFYFEAVSLPAECTVGAFLTEVGDERIVGPDYGVVTCDNPVTGDYDLHVRVHFQDDAPPMDVLWHLEVTEAGTLVIDPVNGSDSSGDGSLANPFQTIESWWKQDPSDRTYSGYQVLYRAGTHDVAADNSVSGVTGGNWRLPSDDKPLVHYGYPGEDVIFDMSDTTIAAHSQSAVGTRATGSDLFFGGLIFEGGPTDRDNPRLFSLLTGTSSDITYDAVGGGSRNVWFENTFRDYSCTTTSSDNAGVLWAPNPGGDNWRHYLLVSRNRFENIENGCNVNWNGFYISKSHKLLEEHTVAIDTVFAHGTVTNKSTGMFMSHRNLDYSQSPGMPFEVQVCGSYDTDKCGPVEFSYSRVNRTAPNVTATTVFFDANSTAFGGGAEQYPLYSYRNNLSRTPSTESLFRIGGGWPVYINRDLWTADEAFRLTGVNVNEADADDFVRFDVADDPFDGNMDLTGADRSTYLGRYGAEIAGVLTE